MISKHCLIVMIMCSFGSCNFLPERRPLTWKKESYNGQSLRTDGYFFEREPDTHRVNSVCLFYANGVMLDAGSFSKKSLEQVDKDLTKPFNDREKNMISMWGIYKIRKDSISFEQYHPGNGGYEVFVRSGIILNDSTFQVTTMRNAYSGDVVELNEIYHFRKFSPKPDSTNNIVQ